VESDIETEGEAGSPSDSNQNSLLEGNSLPITGDSNSPSGNELSRKIVLEVKDMLHYDCIPTNFFQQNFTNAPIRRRGCVVQEELLATRTLHFMKTKYSGDAKI
jgi:hypothetical protein